jgi:hypothetical protein
MTSTEEVPAILQVMPEQNNFALIPLRFSTTSRSDASNAIEAQTIADAS